MKEPSGEWASFENDAQGVVRMLTNRLRNNSRV